MIKKQFLQTHSLPTFRRRFSWAIIPRHVSNSNVMTTNIYLQTHSLPNCRRRCSWTITPRHLSTTGSSRQCSNTHGCPPADVATPGPSFLGTSQQQAAAGNVRTHTGAHRQASLLLGHHSKAPLNDRQQQAMFEHTRVPTCRRCCSWDIMYSSSCWVDPSVTSLNSICVREHRLFCVRGLSSLLWVGGRNS